MKYKLNILRKLVSFWPTRYLYLIFVRLFYSNFKIEENELDTYPNLNIKNILVDLKTNGVSETFLVEEEYLLKIINKCNNNVAVSKMDPKNIQKITYESPENIFQNDFLFEYESVENWAEVNAIIRSKSVLKVARNYLGVEPIIHNVNLFWSFPFRNILGEEMDTPYYGFHYDIDDVKFVKLFLYVTPCDQDSGPHIVIKGTHRDKSIYKFKNRRITNIDAIRLYKDRVVEFIGPRGTSFFEDTFGYHKGKNPLKPRLIFQVEFGVSKSKLG